MAQEQVIDGSRKSEKNSLLCMNIRRKIMNAKGETKLSVNPEKSK